MPKLAILGGKPAKTKSFPAWPIYDERERQALNEVLESGVWWRTPGTKTLAFEREFADFHQAKHGIAVTNGTHALEVALAAMGIGAGDEVIVPNATFVATASAVLFAGALPVLVDVSADSFCIDPELAEAAITENTKAIIAVHMGGRPADLDQLTAVAEKHGIMLLEDAAHAHGSEWRGRKVGTFGAGGSFSFQASKTMTAGEGGMIISNDDDFERLARATHDCGRMPGEWFYDHFVYGSNYRLSEWQGAVLLAQLTRLDEQTARRHENGRLLDRLLRDIPGITPQSHDTRITRNGQYAYIFHYDKRAFAGVDSARFVEALEAEGVPTQAPYPPLHQLDLFTSGAYRDRLSGAQAKAEHAFLDDAFPNSQREAWETVWITQNALLGDETDMGEIAAAVGKISDNARDLL
ncbi:MAG: DegT/DnrJ/EryC1/StrS family aminotransferase [Chloroflexota bacterium]|nr:DegT/DnrJ/EryC1/StrS family aminotransferase [Chloroflexota bacterium]MDE2909637.1 DegT/DnrJ/EryC1/StrS family aminotransferase [Chloroflexota bacterium]